MRLFIWLNGDKIKAPLELFLKLSVTYWSKYDGINTA